MPSIDRDLVALLPNLRAYALFLTGNRADADDLVQDTAVRLLGAADRFEEGTNFKAWAFRVLRNRFLNEFVAKRRRTRPLHELDDGFASVFPDQMDGLELKDLVRQFMRLPPEFRSVLALAGGANMSYEEIAAISGCAVGTVKSRVHRARAALEALLRKAYAPNATPARHAEGQPRGVRSPGEAVASPAPAELDVQS
jgi:RNA polymerase sigma-70 factor (ECF subfamily)